MSDKPTSETGSPQTSINKDSEGPLLLEIKASVEKLAGDVRALAERMNKQDKKPEDEKYPEKAPCKGISELPAAPASPESDDAEKGKKLPLKPEEEKAKKPEELKPKPEKKQDGDHGCSAEEDWDEVSGTCVPKKKQSQDKKPGEYPYPEEKPGEKKSSELIQAQFDAMNTEISTLRKCLGIPAVKRTQVLKSSDLDTPIDVSSMSWPQIHEMVRPIDLRRGA